MSTSDYPGTSKATSSPTIVFTTASPQATTFLTTLMNTTTTSTKAAANKVTKITGTMEVEIDVVGTFSQEELEEMFKRALAEALDISIEHVVKLTVSESKQGTGLRRLQSIQTKRYEVSYEVTPPKFMDVDVLVERANRIATTSSVESEVFRQVLKSTDGVAKVGQIALKVPAHKFMDENTTSSPPTQMEPPKDETSQTPLVVGGIAVVAVSFAVVGAILIRRKMANAKSQVSPKNESEEYDTEAVIVRMPSNTLLQSHAIRQAWEVKERQRVDPNRAPAVSNDQASEPDVEAPVNDAVAAPVPSSRPLRSQVSRQAWLATEVGDAHPNAFSSAP